MEYSHIGRRSSLGLPDQYFYAPSVIMRYFQRTVKKTVGEVQPKEEKRLIRYHLMVLDDDHLIFDF